jgi:hypothetical protein
VRDEYGADHRSDEAQQAGVEVEGVGEHARVVPQLEHPPQLGQAHHAYQAVEASGVGVGVAREEDLEREARGEVEKEGGGEVALGDKPTVLDEEAALDVPCAQVEHEVHPKEDVDANVEVREGVLHSIGRVVVHKGDLNREGARRGGAHSKQCWWCSTHSGGGWWWRSTHTAVVAPTHVGGGGSDEADG